MIRSKLWCGVVLLWGCSWWGYAPLTVPPAQPGVYYVAPDGNDEQPGTAGQPWRTLQHAAETLRAGETVYVLTGVYHERVIPQASGYAGHFITYAAYPGATPTIDGTGLTLPDELAGLFEIAGRSYIRVSGLRIANAGPYADNAGLLVIDSDHIIVEQVTTYQTASSGIGVWGSQQITLAGNTVDLAGSGGGQECITVAGTDTFEVRYNTVVRCQKEGIDAKDGAANGKIYRNHVYQTQAVGIYVDAWDKSTHDIEVFQNRVHDILRYDGIALASEAGGTLAAIKVYNNLIYSNTYAGLALAHNGSGGPLRDIQIVNNTIYDNGRTWGGGLVVDTPDVQAVVIRNNLVSDNLAFQIVISPGIALDQITVDHNLINGFGGVEGETRGTDYVEGDPRFVHAAAADFYLRADSPALDAGTALAAPPVDYDGRVRPQDGNADGVAAYDIGAYERGVYPHMLYLPVILKTASGWWRPARQATLQIQFTGAPIDQTVVADLYDLDLFETEPVLVAALHAQGRHVICYINAGAWEDWRPDQDAFPAAVLGKKYAGWPGERWLDIRRLDLLAPLMRARLDQCRAKGFGGVEPDNINGYLNDTGFPLTAQDQLTYNRWLAQEAHARGLAIGLKNDTEQATELQPLFDWVITESCLVEGWCAQAAPFIAAGKPVWAIEYTDTVTADRFRTELCPQAATLGVNAALKRRTLDAWRQACP